MTKNIYVFEGGGSKPKPLAVIDMGKYSENDSKATSAILYKKINNVFTLEIDIPTNCDASQSITNTSDLVLYDTEGNLQEFHVTELTDLHEYSVIRTVYAEQSISELIEDIITSSVEMPTTTNPADYLAYILSFTRWSVGTIDSSIYNSRWKEDLTGKNCLEALQMFIDKFNCEFIVRYESDNKNRITGRYIDIKKTIGNNYGKRFEDTKDINALKRNLDLDSIKTAIYPRITKQSNDENGNSTVEYIDISTVEWSVAAGDPVDKPLGQTILVDPDANTMYKRLNSKTGKLQERIMYAEWTEQTAKDAEDLCKQAWRILKANSVIYPSYEVTASDLYKLSGNNSDYAHEQVSLGDTCIIIDRKITPELRATTRVVEIEEDLLNPINNKYVFGKYRQTLATSNVDQQKSIEEKLAELSGRIQGMTIPEVKPQYQSGKVYYEDIKQDIQNEFMSANGYVMAEDSNGFWVMDAPQGGTPTKALILKGGNLAIATYNTVTSAWEVGTFINGTSVNADYINTGHIAADVIASHSITTDHLTSSAVQYIRTGMATDEDLQGVIDSVANDYATKDSVSNNINNAVKDLVSTSNMNSAISSATKDMATNGSVSSAITNATKDMATNSSVNSAITNATKDMATNSSVNSAITNATKDMATNSGVNSAINSATKDMATNSSVNTAINNIQIGGRNLLLKSDIDKYGLGNWENNDAGGKGVVEGTYIDGTKTIKITGNNGIKYNTTIKLKRNTTYMYSMMMKPTNDITITTGEPLHMWLSTTNGDSQHLEIKVSASGTMEAGKWGKAWVVFKTPDAADAYYMKPFIYDIGSNTVYICKVKVEEGNKATDWTPAPEDVEEQNRITRINAIKDLQKQLQAEYSENNSKANKVYSDQYLPNGSTAKVNLNNKMAAYTTAYNNYNNYITTMIADGTVTEAEYNQYNTYATAYANATKGLAEAIEDANSARLANVYAQARQGLVTTADLEVNNQSVIASAKAGMVSTGDMTSSITAATENLVSNDALNSAISSATADMATNSSVTSAISTATKDMATNSSVNSAINNATQDMATNSSVNSAITNATKDMATTTIVNTAVTNATKDMATNSSVNSAISNATKDMATNSSVNTAVSNATKDKVTNTQMNTAINNATKDMATNTSVNSAITNATKDKVTNTQMNSAINNATQDMATNSNVNSAIDAIKIGGTNLAKQTKLLTSKTGDAKWKVLSTGTEGFNELYLDSTSTDWVECQIPLYTEINSLTSPVTVSFEYQETTAGVLLVSFASYKDNNRLREVYNYEVSSNFNVIATRGEWKYVSCTFDPAYVNGQTGATHYKLQFKKASGKTGTIHVRKIKMEIGNKATDWTPAPQDVTDYSNMASRIESIVQSYNAITTEYKNNLQQATTLYSNSYLGGTAKTNLNNAKSDYTTKYNAVTSAYNNVVADAILTNAEVSAWNTALTNLQSSTTTLAQRVQEATTFINTAVYNASKTYTDKAIPDALTGYAKTSYVDSAKADAIADAKKGMVSTSQLEVNNTEILMKTASMGQYNILRNSDFRSGTNYWFKFDGSQAPNSWGIVNDSDAVVISGEKAMRTWINNGSGATVWNGFYQDVTLAADTSYTLSYWVCNYNCTGRVGVWKGTANDNMLASKLYNTPTSGNHNRESWIYDSITFTTPSGGTYRMFFQTKDAPSSGGYGLFLIKPMLATGINAQAWTAHPDEIHVGVVSVTEERGIMVEHSDADSYSTLDSDGLKVWEYGNDSPVASFGEGNTAFIDTVATNKIICEAVRPTIDINGNYYIYFSNTGSGDYTGRDANNCCAGFTGAMATLCRNRGINTTHIHGDFNIRGNGWIYFYGVGTSLDEDIVLQNIYTTAAINIILPSGMTQTGSFRLINLHGQVTVTGGRSNMNSNDGCMIKRDGQHDGIYIRNCSCVNIEKLRFSNSSKDAAAVSIDIGSNVHVSICDFYQFYWGIYVRGYCTLFVDYCRGTSGFSGVVLYDSFVIYNGYVPAGNSTHDVNHDIFMFGCSAKLKGTASDANTVPQYSVQAPAPITSQVVTSSFSATYYQSVRQYTITDLYQAAWDGSGGYGEYVGEIYFGDALKNWLSGATGISAQIYLQRQSSQHGYYSGAKVKINGTDVGSLALGEGKWFNVPSNVCAGLQDGSINHVSLNGTGNAYYCKFEKNVTIKVTATKRI